MADVRSKAERVFTNYLCYKVDPLWRRLPASERQLGEKSFARPCTRQWAAWRCGHT